MIVSTTGLKIFGVPIAKKPVQPGFRRQTDGTHMWIAFPKALKLSSPNMAATFAAPRGAFQSNPQETAPARGMLRPLFIGRRGRWHPGVHRQTSQAATVPVHPCGTRSPFVK